MELSYFLINGIHPYRIKKLKTLTEEQKEQAINYFKTHRICRYCKEIYTSSKVKGIPACDNIECQNKKVNELQLIKNKREQNNLKKYGVKYYLNEKARRASISKQTPEMKKNRLLKSQETLIKKYGSKNYNNPEKHKQTLIKKYGSLENAYKMQGLRIKEAAKKWDKIAINEKRKKTITKSMDNNPNYYKEKDQKSKNTKLQKYGDENYNNIERRKETIKSRYGVDNISQLPEIQSKIKLTNIKKFKANHAMQTNEYKDKVKVTNSEKYGMWPTQTPEVKNKTIQTNIEKYGVPFISQKHLKNLSDLNLDFITKNFIHNGVLEYPTALDYYGYKSSYSPIITILLENNIKFTIKRRYCLLENEFLNNLSYFLGVDILRQYILKPSRYRADGFISNTNFKFKQWEFNSQDRVVIEFLGDYWHGYKNNEELNHLNETFSSLYSATFRRFDKIKSLGYKILYIWESDYLRDEIGGIRIY